MAITENLKTDSARIRAINDWVYHNKGFVKNDRYFIVAALGPTPIQVMEQGGECGDKSRLVAAMLTSLGIDAGLVMIAPCQHCGFIHTVVEAQYEAGRMVVDPTWDVDYPTGNGRFLGVRDLAGTNRGRE
ncbi:MAG TPA: transglutaminase-like domain-containing protein, partial [Stellaceae bacterium]|nr:transglutaminase-like domain-containing protein [Stellaceae bacterium]